ncbi:response regulator [Alcanivorax sp. JB21]|uniref:EAL domain-containing response regulator n=1 Tax=Alcanivorax limicola TaxID=2874102 RepID=UPI001CBABD00|nr:response regulator [Alcanivorax limicola]MBZ2190231.1 response regulator [Alcanivorax limicola]
MTDDAYAQKMRELRLQYLKALPAHAKVLNEHWRRLRHVSWEAPSVQAMYQTAHKLAGSGTTFGYQGITVAARELENLLSPLLETGEVASAARREAIDAAMQGLVRALDAALKGKRAAETAATADVPAPAVADSGLNARIALVEDDEVLAGQLRLWLEQWGCEAIWFSTPEDFEQALSRSSFDLLLLDVSFPDAPMGGVDWLTTVRERRGLVVPVVMLSARTDVMSRLRALRAGAASYLPKPVAQSDLKARLESLLTHRDANRERVLVVDDDVQLSDWLRTAMEAAGFSVKVLNQPLGILDAMERVRPDILVLDYQMPGINGVEVARLLRQDSRYLDIPIIFVSGDASAFDHQEEFSIVGNAFLTKPLDEKVLVQKLRLHLDKARQVSRRMQMASVRQSPEGLQNRAFFLGELNNALAARRLRGDSAGELLLHLMVSNSDYLRQRHGVVAAAALQDRIERQLAAHPAIAGQGCLWGEFVFLLRVSMPDNELAEEFVEKLRQQLAETDFVSGEGQNAVFSLGAVLLDGSQGNVEQALLATEKACAEALKNKAGTTVLASSVKSKARQPADQAVRKAISARGYKLFFQPIVNLESNEPLFEVSVRLEDDAGNIYPPDQFLNFVEHYADGGLSGLDRWVIEHTINEMTTLRGKEAESWAVVIRLSPVSETLDKILPFIANALQNSRLKGARRVYFSLPERFVLRQPARVAEFFGHLHTMHCGVIIDEVAAEGDSGLLTEVVRPDMIKLDASWNQRIRQRAEAEPALKRLIEYVGGAENVVAASIEDAQIFAAFWDFGIRHFQGFFIQEPGDALALETQI